MIHVLNQLLQRHRLWKWSKACQRAFRSAKYALASNWVLAHYNPGLPLKLAADTSSYGVGAVISHQYPNGSEGQLLLHHGHLRQVKRIIHSLRKRRWPLSLELRSSINIFMGDSSRCLLIIGHWLPSWVQRT